LYSKPGSGTDQLADRTHDEECQCEARAHTEAVEHGIEHTVFGSKHLRPPQNDAVYHDQWQIDAQRAVDRGSKCLDEHLHNGDKPRDNNNIAGDSHLIRDDVLEQCDYHIGANQYEGGGNSHTNPVDGHCGNGKSGAGAQQKDKDRVFL
jgi:hypothetical protein